MTLKPVEPVKLDVNNVKQVLADAAEREFHAVIVFGYKDDKIHIMKSGIKGIVEVLGAIEVVKQDLWSGA
jgi:hypothetical protein